MPPIGHYSRHSRHHYRRRSGTLGLLAVFVASLLTAAGLLAVTQNAAATRADAVSLATDPTISAAPPAGDPNPGCTIVVPPDPLSAVGLATPYQLTATDPANGPCNEANNQQTAFVQAAIINARTGAISVYDPLVIDQGTTPAIRPRVPAVPPRSVVAVWFGYNGNVLTLADSTGGRTLGAASCVSGLGSGPGFSAFTQMAYCNAPAFFAAAGRAIRTGRLTVPAPGIATDGLPCLTVRGFALIDQDQSDNVTTEYLATAAGQTAPDTAANAGALAGASVLFNGSDNGLLDFFVDPSLGCQPWRAPDLADPGATASALPLDELQAAAFAGRGRSGPQALVPLNDPMTEVNGQFSRAKTDLYRIGVDQPPLPAGQRPMQYCTDLEDIQAVRLQQDVSLLAGNPGPAPAAASNLFTFLASRLAASFANLNCANFGLQNQVSLSTNSAGVVVAACFLHQVRPLTPGPLTPGPGNPAAGQAVCPAAAATAAKPAGSSALAPAPVAPGPSAPRR